MKTYDIGYHLTDSEAIIAREIVPARSRSQASAHAMLWCIFLSRAVGGDVDFAIAVKPDFEAQDPVRIVWP